MKILSRIPVILSAIIMLCALNNARAQLTVNIKVNEIPYSVGMDPFCNAPLELSFYDFQIGENPMDPQPTEVEKVQWVVNGATLVIGDGVTPMPLEDGFITISPNLGQNSVQVTVWADNKEYVIRNSARIDVIENATAEFTATPACANSETEFINQSQNAGSYLWSFGDGTSSTELTPGHLYTTPGTYTVILKAYTTDGTCYDMVSHTVEVYDNAPQAAFTTEDVCLGYPVQFINQSTGADSYTWTFSCPAIPYESSTTQPNPSHFFAVAETYTVELVATNSCASSTITSQVTVMDGVGSVLIGAPAVACEDVQVDFTATTVAGASYNWSFGDGVTSTDQNPSHTFTIAGNYTVMLEVDDGTCSNTFSHYVIVSAIPLAGVNVSGNTTICEGEATTLEANIYNQTPGESYTYEWSLNGNILGTQPTIGVTQGGVYLLTVYGNCEYDVAQSPYIIVNPVPVASMSTDAPAACADYNNGTATVTSDDPGDYTYAWSNSASTTATANDLFSGTNFVTVTNTFGCNTMVNTYIPAQNMVLSASTTPTDCNVDNGTAQVSVTSGGNGSYDYAWSSGGDNNQETGLGVGAYSVTVTDSYGCIAVKNNINVGTYILNVTVQTTDIACGTTTATITANVSAQGYNPETPLTWTWYDANTGNPVSGLPNSNVVDLPAGDYYAEVSDNNSCSGESADFSVLDDEPLSLTSTSQDVSCPGDIDGAIQIQTKSGVGPFTYDWSTGEHVSDISGLAPGAYTVTVTDANGCIAELTVTINEPTPLSFTGQYINCQALLTGGGGTPGYQFEWYQVETPDDPPQTVNILEATTSVNFMAGLIGGQYMVSVTDASGCVFETDPFTVNARPEVRIIPIEFRYVEPVISDPPPSEEVIPEIIMTADDAQDALNDAYDACMASCNDDITSALNKSCLSDKAVKDVFSINYDLDYYHYTLYYYDRAGNLVTTVPPEGVDILDVNDPVEGEDILNRLVHPNHTMKTTCEYNSLNQTIKTTTPDGGATVFLYDELGRRRFSQNAEQALTTNNSYSYIKYDDLGRTIEVGECSQNESDLFDGSTPDLSEYADNFPQIGCTNVHRTIYSKLSDIDYFGEPQEHLLNRISYVITDRDGDFSTDNDQVVTYYSYDVHGNVKWLVQDLPGFTKNYIAYEYDLYSGNVLLVKYNEMRPDRFFHKYKYNADNNITDVYTSRDGYLWDRDANYEYTEFGEVDRIHIGDDNIQGLDYTYNINGWLKAINHPDLEASWDPSTGAEPVDPGADGFAGSDMPYDVFGMTLGYYEGDFNRSDSPFKDANYFSETSNKNLYNGNITSWTSKWAQPAAYSVNPFDNQLTARIFEYDKLNRIKTSNFEYLDDAGVNDWVSTSDYYSEYDYDGNGNIDVLVRNSHTISGDNQMDDLSYTYVAGTNKLASVSENLTASNANGQLNDFYDQHDYYYDAIGNLDYEVSPEEGTAYNIITDFDWNFNGKIDKVNISRELTPNDLELIRTINFTYDAGGNRIIKDVVNDEGDPLQNNREYYLRDATGNPLAVYYRIIENSTTTGYDYDVVFRLKEIPLHGTDRLGMIKPSLSNMEEIYRVPVMADQIENVDFDINGILVNSELYHWIAPRNANVILSAGEDPTCDCQVEKMTFTYDDGSESYTVTNQGHLKFFGKAGNNVCVTENEDGDVLFYTVTASNYLGNENVTLVLDRDGNLMKDCQGIISSPESKSMAMKRPGNNSDYYLVTIGDDQQAYYHTISMSDPGFGTSADPLGRVTDQNQLMPNGDGVGRHMALVEDQLKNKNYLYVSKHVSLSANSKTNLMVYEVTKDGPGVSSPHLMGWISGTDEYGDGELQLSSDGKKLLYYNRTDQIGNFSFNNVDLVVMGLMADRVTINQDNIEHITSYGGTRGKASADFTNKGKNVLFNQQSLMQNQVWNLNLTGLTATLSSVNEKGDVRRGKDMQLYVPGEENGQFVNVLNLDGDNITYPATQPLTGSSSYLLSGALPGQALRFKSKLQGEDLFERYVGDKLYEIKDHLGNVRVVVTDVRDAIISSGDGNASDIAAHIRDVADYYPFGSIMPGRYYPANTVPNGGYRFGFNGKEKDDEVTGVTGATYDYGFRIYDSRIARFLSVDPLTKSYPWYTPYQFAGNMPIVAVDLDGLEPLVTNGELISYEAKSNQNYSDIADDINNQYIKKYYGYSLITKVTTEELINDNQGLILTEGALLNLKSVYLRNKLLTETFAKNLDQINQNNSRLEVVNDRLSNLPDMISDTKISIENLKETYYELLSDPSSLDGGKAAAQVALIELNKERQNLNDLENEKVELVKEQRKLNEENRELNINNLEIKNED